MTEFSSGSGDNYQVGGSLPADAPSYVRRASDDLLYDALRADKFCYVLNSRQMGKSSLKVQTIQRLQAEGVACAAIDLTRIGAADITAEQWYSSVIDSIVGSLDLYETFDLYTWWEEHRLLSNVRRLDKFIEEILLTSTSQKIVIFIDEIDSVIGLPFKLGDFFALVRECYNRRANHHDYGRLTFVLLGVTTLSDLMQGQLQTPFNIGQEIALEGFQLDECESLVQGLAAKSSNPQALMQAILTWTGGQPFLTQKVCKLMLNENSMVPDGQEEAWVVDLVRARVIENWEAQDTPEHLKTIRDRVLYSGDEKGRGRLLGLYQQVLGDPPQPPLLKGGEELSLASSLQEEEAQPPFARGVGGISYGIPVDDSYEQMQLRLTGLVVKRDRYLVVYNPIYAAVFNQQWVAQALSDLRPAFYGSAFLAWRESGEQQESFLLRGQALVDAEAWAKGKRLSDEDDRFLQFSREVEKQAIALSLEAERLTNERLNEAKEKAVRRVKIGSYILVGTLILSFVAAVSATIYLKETAQIATNAKAEADKANQDVVSAREEVAGIKLKSAEEKEKAQQDINKAKDKQKEAEGKVKEAKQDLNVAKSELENVSQQSAEKVSAAQAKIADAEAKVKQAIYKQQTAGIDIKLADVRLKSVNAKATFQSNQVFDSLLQSIRAGNELKKLDRSVWKRDDTQRQLELVLYHSVYGVRERNKSSLSSDNSLRRYSNSHRSGEVFRVTFSPDGKTVAAIVVNEVKLLSLDGGELLNLSDSQINASNVIFSPDSKTIATVEGSEVKLRSLDGKELQTFSGYNCYVSSLVFSSDGKTITSVCDDRTVKLWSIDGRELKTFIGNGNREHVRKMLLSPDGKTIASVDWKENWKLLSIDGRELSTFSRVSTVAFSPDGKTIASKHHDGEIKLWNLKGEELETFFGSKKGKFLAFSPDGKNIFSMNDDGSMELWNLQVERQTPQIFTGLNVDFNEMTLSPDGKNIATVSYDETVRVWSVDGQQVPTFTSDWERELLFSPDGKVIATVNEKTVKLWSIEGKEIQTLKGHSEPVHKVLFSPNSKMLASISNDRTIKLWDLNGRELQTFKNNNTAFRDIAFSPDGNIIATTSICFPYEAARNECDMNMDNSVKLWSLDGRELQTFAGNEVLFIPDGKILVADRRLRVITESQSTESQSSINLWTIEGRLLQTFIHPGYIRTLVVSPDGKILATVSPDKIILWSFDGRLLQTFSDPNTAIYTLAFSPDSKIIASSGRGKTVKLWSIDGQDLQTLTDYDDYGGSGKDANPNVVFSPDGKIVYSRRWDDSVKAWSIDGQELTTFSNSNRNSFWSVAFSPDGKIIISENNKGSVKLRNLDFDDLMAKGCDWLHDYLTNNPNANDEDRQMCGIEPRQK